MDGQVPQTSFRDRRPMAGLVVTLVVAVVAVVTWRVLGQPHAEQTAPPPIPEAEPEAAWAPMPPPPPNVDLARGDQMLASLARSLSKSLELGEWLSGPDLIRRVAGAVETTAEGSSPRLFLRALAPKGRFQVEAREGKTFISPKSDARYDAVAQVIASIDAAALGKLYADLRPYFELVHREVGRPGTHFDDVLAKALDYLTEVPLDDSPRQVVAMTVGTGYAWADPKLEALSAAQKHLLRMGPKNARAVVAQLKAFKAEALSSSATTSRQ